MRYYAVIDTNVLVSAMLKRFSYPDRVIQEVLKGKIVPLLNKEIIEEYWNVLQRPKFKFPEKAFIVDPRKMVEIIEEARQAEEGDE